MSRSAILLARVGLATVLGFGAMIVATEVDPRFAPVFAYWLSASAARVPYVTAGADTMLAGALAGASFVLLSLGRGRRSAYALAALAVGVAVFTFARARIGGPRSDNRRVVLLATVPAALADGPANPGCGRAFATPMPAGQLTTTITCTSHEGPGANQAEMRQRRDDLRVSFDGHALLVQRVCTSEGGGSCRWRAGPSPDPAPEIATSVVVDLATIARPTNADDVLTVDWLVDFAAFRVRDPSGQIWDFAGESGREMLGPILEGHRAQAHGLGPMAVLVSFAGSVAAIALLAMMEQRLRRERRFAGARTGTVSEQVVTFTDGSSARIIDGGPQGGAVTKIPPRRAAGAPVGADTADAAAYRDAELVRAADLAVGSADALAASQQRKAAILRAMLLAVVALTVVPVAVAWVRSTASLPPLPLLPVDRPLTARP